LELLDGLYESAKKAGYDVILSALTTRRDERRAVETCLISGVEAAFRSTHRVFEGGFVHERRGVSEFAEHRP